MLLCSVLCRQSYDIDIELGVSGSGVTSTNTLDLKNPCFRYSGQQVQAPPGTNHTSPTDAYWASAFPDAASKTILFYSLPLLEVSIELGKKKYFLLTMMHTFLVKVRRF